MTIGAYSPFGVLLKRHRAAAGLTQEELAERAHLSVQAVSALERGVNQRPHGDTVALLAEALALREDERAALMEAARSPARQATEPPGTAPAGSPPLHRSNLPLALTSFIGRERELATVGKLLGETRLLTLTGAGGCGKTRLALQLAGALLAEYPDGVWLVELAALSSPELLPQGVATALGAQEQPGRPLLATLTDFLRSKQLLLVLDNCEHLVHACAELAMALLQVCGGVRILATSREGLEVSGETTYLVPSLEVPDPWQVLPPAELLGYAGIRLCVERARARRHDFALTAQNVAAVAHICHRLDGIPLAIELAAARMDALPVEGIAARLDDCFQLLIGGPRVALPRQRTLRATLDWSYGLLTAQEQTLLSRLSVFAGGWTLEAAETICTGDGVEAWEALDLLAGLVRKSLVQLEEREGGARYRLLDTVRQYGHEKLTAAGELAALRERYLAWYLALAERAAPLLRGAAQAAWLGRLEREHDNLRAALHWAREGRRLVLEMRLAAALGRFWWMRGHLSEGRGWLEGMLAPPGSDGAVAASVRADIANWAGVLAGSQGDYRPAAALHQQSLDLYQAMGDSRGSAESLHNLGVVAQHQGNYQQAVRLLEESLLLRRDLRDIAGTAESLSLLGLIAAWQGDFGRSELMLEESLALYRNLEDKRGVADAIGNLGWPTKYQGKYEQAEALSAESQALYRALGDKQGIASTLRMLGAVACEQGDYRRAEAATTESLALFRELGSRRGIATALTDLAWVAYYQGECGQAAALVTQSLTLFRGLESHWGVAFSLRTLGAVARAQGELARATAFYHESLTIYRAAGEKPSIAACLDGLADGACAQGQWRRAARLLGAATALRGAIGAPRRPIDRAPHDRTVGELSTELGDEVFQAAWAAGRSLPLDQAIAEALNAPTLPEAPDATGRLLR